jgi:hypothetical protein
VWYGEHNLPRLVAAKQKWDPTDQFGPGMPVPLSRTFIAVCLIDIAVVVFESHRALDFCANRLHKVVELTSIFLVGHVVDEDPEVYYC